MHGRRWLCGSWAALGLMGCGNGSGGDGSPAPPAADAAIDVAPVFDAGPADAGSPVDAATDAGPTVDPSCPEKQILDGGIACAIAPSATRAGISDAFGHHAIGVPASATASTPLFVYFRGTGAKPFDPGTRQYPTSALRVLQEAVDHGRLGLMLAYDNDTAPQDLCKDDLACYGGLRREIMLGIEGGDPGDVQHVRPPDDVMSRIEALVAHLHAIDQKRFPAEVDWANARLGGGSQGGGHAVFIAKELETVAWVCNLAGLGDSNAAGEPAGWITSATWMTPLARMRAVIHADDPWFARTTNVWKALGFELDVSWRQLSGFTFDPHAFPLSADPTAAAARKWACFDP